MGQPELVPGVYERLVDQATRRTLERLSELTAEERGLLEAEAPERLAGNVAERLHATLRRAGDLEEQVALAQRLLALLDDADDGTDPSWLLDEPASVLTRIGRPLLPGEEPPAHPLIPLSDSDLLVNARDEPRLGEALLRELETADRVDLIVAFVRWAGIRILLDPRRPMQLLVAGKAHLALVAAIFSPGRGFKQCLSSPCPIRRVEWERPPPP
jgi:hypothetical protein